MERKLLSLPSFFVLLLIAGIAFLAAPVEDVDAVTLPDNSVTVTEDGSNIVYTVMFDGAIAGITGTGTTPITAAAGFGPEDLEITRAYSKPSAVEAVTLNRPGEFTIAALPARTTPAPTRAANQHFTVTVPKDLANSAGTIALTLAATPVANDAGGTAVTDWTGQANIQNGHSTGLRGTWDDHDGDAPTVTFAEAVGTTSFTAATGTGNNARDAMYAVTGTDVFQVKVEFNEALGTGSAFTTSDVAIATMPALEAEEGEDPPDDTRSTATAVWAAGDSTATAPKYIVVITPYAMATSLEITVKKDAVADASGNKSAATKATVTVNRLPEVTFELTIDHDSNPETAPVAVTTAPVATTVGEVNVTFKLSASPPTGNDDLEADEITVSSGGGTLGAFKRDLAMEPTATVKASYTATLTLPEASARKSPVTITVAKEAVTVNSLKNVAESTTFNVVVPPAPTGPVTAPTGTTGGALTDAVGFDLTGTVAVTIPANGFVVLAKSPEDAGFTGALTSEIDVIDDRWVNLRHFLVTTEGGTIDLIGPTSTPVKSVVISEVMWGNDNGLSDPTNSQWIELYNTTGADITLTNWKLQFSTKSYGQKMHTGDDAKASATATTGALTNASNPVVDKFSTWREVGNYWLWEITDTAGGKYGQSGKSTRNSAQSPGNPVELISMQRKIDYAKVEKTDHVAGTENTKVAENRNKQLEGIPGTGSGNWEASPEHGHLLTYRKGTPGAAPTIKKHDKTNVPRGSVVFNEIANRSDKKHDWIELYNKSGSAKKINGWELSLVTGTDNDAELFTFTSGTNGDDIVVPAKGYLLIVNTDPRNTTLEGGYDVVNPGNSARQSDGAGTKPSRLYYVSDKLDIPEKDFLLILRNGNDKTGTHEKIEDVAGNNPDFPKNADNTDVWPLRVWDLGATNDLGQNNDKTWKRDQGKAVFNGDEWKPEGGFTGLGIDRKYSSSDAYTSGTPGYDNGAVKGEVKSDGLTHANPVIISEIMFGAGNTRVPQWIELHNPSHTQAVNLKNWKLDILNYYSDETLEIDLSATLTLPEVRIQPNQTVLIVSTTGRNSGSDEFPDDRIINVWSNTDLRQALKMQDRRNAILSATGFHLKLSDPQKTVVDEVGNIDANRRSNDEPDWTLPGGNFDGTRRSSMVRDLAGSAGDGTEQDAWRDAVMVDSDTIKADELYYGDNEDVGTPGYTPGGVLPVQLSSFYSKRNDAGAVVITWSTESELDNAGFNILRSMSRTGEFTRINAQLIPGAGTTGEKNTYTWTDTSARPNVVYYYQIEDVSLEGEHRTLRTTRLRGHVGAAGKATVIWGELKSRK